MNTSKSDELFSIANKYIPGGVNSPVRAFGAVQGNPVFINKGQGCRIWDVDGNEYIDYVCSWGPLILGHSYPAVVEAIHEAASKGISYGAPCETEVELARLICEAIPSMEMVRMVNSGTEATMSAIRLARAYTGRQLILKFEGCYHGHADSFLIKAGSGMMTTGVPTSPGVPEVLAEKTLVAVYNDISSVEQQFRRYGQDIAAVIIEPVAANMGLVLPEPQFLKELRRITELYGSLLIFDEVITGFRTCFGGFQNLINIRPDLTTLGKIIGGGLPVGAYGGRRDIMQMVSPSGSVYQAGTLSGNPLAMAAGLATLKELKNSDWYDRLEVVTYYLTNKLKPVFEEHDYLFEINQLTSMFTVFFTENAVNSYDHVKTSDTEFYGRFHRALLKRGVYWPPSQFEVCFVSCAHELEDVDITIEAVDEALDEVGQR
ncbi:MAG: glutamate-1-semialdehyde 2,1-aminomutase [Syntrophomonadaceae bacterium]|jgi:glutamate-1-semialdehyde 2,1-aminomutase|nr:glutamate-1-semialdehyde 2,1-aminomutase [Bacillota bacterium]NLM88416.1 glutamate-1-semialdehyde 2,1-aminomutase [Syntrophomonadaceae bacterium]HAA09705.1 glutamate-1-semialdehyde-2,1-aminomutase [Syntrophomonas sp.]HQA49614.1 glutamate-1-semialdehyde 2,1-aminomutase [Syntrophomonadaceae bacterium]